MQDGDTSLLRCDKMSKQTVTADFISKGRWHRLGDVLRLKIALSRVPCFFFLSPRELSRSCGETGMSWASQLLFQSTWLPFCRKEWSHTVLRSLASNTEQVVCARVSACMCLCMCVVCFWVAEQ